MAPFCANSCTLKLSTVNFQPPVTLTEITESRVWIWKKGYSKKILEEGKHTSDSNNIMFQTYLSSGVLSLYINSGLGKGKLIDFMLPVYKELPWRVKCSKPSKIKSLHFLKIWKSTQNEFVLRTGSNGPTKEGETWLPIILKLKE